MQTRPSLLPTKRVFHHFQTMLIAPIVSPLSLNGPKAKFYNWLKVGQKSFRNAKVYVQRDADKSIIHLRKLFSCRTQPAWHLKAAYLPQLWTFVYEFKHMLNKQQVSQTEYIQMIKLWKHLQPVEKNQWKIARVYIQSLNPGLLVVVIALVIGV